MEDGAREQSRLPRPGTGSDDAARRWPRPGPGSPFHVPPPSTRRLRWQAVLLAVVPTVVLVLFVVSLVSGQWVVAGVYVPLLVLYAWLRWRQYRVLVPELRRRATEKGGDGSHQDPP